MASEIVPELTRISSKGQVVIPARVRNRLGLRPGNLFAILTRPESDMVVLKKVDNKTLQADLTLLREVEKAWKEITGGKTRTASRKRFLEELQTW
jgi:AbrB family looped-hinge helix DNA binding protein